MVIQMCNTFTNVLCGFVHLLLKSSTMPSNLNIYLCLQELSPRVGLSMFSISKNRMKLKLQYLRFIINTKILTETSWCLKTMYASVKHWSKHVCIKQINFTTKTMISTPSELSKGSMFFKRNPKKV